MPYVASSKAAPPPSPDPFEVMVREATVLAGRQARSLFDVLNYERALLHRNWMPIVTDWRWRTIEHQLTNAFEAALGAKVQAGGDAELGRLRRQGLALTPGGVAKAELAGVFNLRNPFSEDFIRRRGAAMVEGVTVRARAQIRDTIEEGMVRGVPVRATARAIRESIGLDPRLQRAVGSMVERMTADGATDEEIEAASQRYADKLLAYRAETIARTETMAASNQGVLDSWRQAAREGLIPGGMLKRWIHAEGSARTCPICNELGSLEPVPMNGSFYSSILGEEFERPPVHPNCRCTIGLVRG